MFQTYFHQKFFENVSYVNGYKFKLAIFLQNFRNFKSSFSLKKNE